MRDLIIIGAGDFGREVVNLVDRINSCSSIKLWDVKGFIDDSIELRGKKIDGCPVIGTIEDLNGYTDEIYAVCSLGVANIRKTVIERITNPNVKFATLVDPDAEIYRQSTIGEGSVICGGSILAINTQIGNHVIVNLNCTLGHDAVIGDYCVINPGTNVSGKVRVSECSNLGTGSKVIQGICIGSGTTIGAGAAVINDIPPNCVAVGVPAKPIKYL